VLEQSAARLKQDLPVFLISLEAGVDLDFPLAVYRACATAFDQLLVAGRCNRGEQSAPKGRVVICEPRNDKIPPGGMCNS